MKESAQSNNQKGSKKIKEFDRQNKGSDNKLKNATGPSPKSKKVKRKHTAGETAEDEPATKHAKFSSLFKNNPEIPQVQT